MGVSRSDAEQDLWSDADVFVFLILNFYVDPWVQYVFKFIYFANYKNNNVCLTSMLISQC